MQIDTELLSEAVRQGFELHFEIEKGPFWDRDEITQVFYFIAPAPSPNHDRIGSKEFRSFEAFQDHLRMAIKKSRNVVWGIGNSD